MPAVAGLLWCTYVWAHCSLRVQLIMEKDSSRDGTMSWGLRCHWERFCAICEAFFCMAGQLHAMQRVLAVGTVM